MRMNKRRKYKEFLVKLLRLGQTRITVHRKNLRIMMAYFDLKNESTATRYLKEMEQADMLTYDIRTNSFKIQEKLDNKSKIDDFKGK